ncbi:hypothetical protein NQ314_012982 [Rhamnusium bicolor]|uniref:Uncharacterized protein n=1 Tax=Rhamnusium bicolor TaxID=1586634 RepID=A0AAV8X8K5_9CUCU|nr:hypothetical protein NQ314_012982 [Rhamnusium bicolor]
MLLLDLLYNEERQYYHETIKIAQEGQDFKMGEMKKRAEILRANREEERLKIVHQKRIEQYR